MSSLTPELCLEASHVASSLMLKIIFSVRIVLGLVGAFCIIFLLQKKGVGWIPHPNGKLLYLAHMYFAFHVSAFFSLMYIFQLLRSSLPSSDPCFYALDARFACLIRLIPGIGIHFQSFNMFSFSLERAMSTFYPRMYEQIKKPILAILLIALTVIAAFAMDYFAMYYPIPENVYVSVLTSKNNKNMYSYGIINYVPFSVELLTITIFAVTYRINLTKNRQWEQNGTALGDKYQISENLKVIRTLFPCFVCHFAFSISSYGLLTILPILSNFDLVTNLIWVECISQAMTYSVALPLIVFIQSKRRNIQVFDTMTVTDMYFSQLNDLFNNYDKRDGYKNA